MLERERTTNESFQNNFSRHYNSYKSQRLLNSEHQGAYNGR